MSARRCTVRLLRPQHAACACSSAACACSSAPLHAALEVAPRQLAALGRVGVVLAQAGEVLVRELLLVCVRGRERRREDVGCGCGGGACAARAACAAARARRAAFRAAAPPSSRQSKFWIASIMCCIISVAPTSSWWPRQREKSTKTHLLALAKVVEREDALLGRPDGRSSRASKCAHCCCMIQCICEVRVEGSWYGILA